MTDKPYGYWLPIDISTHGYEIDRLINIVHIFMAVLFIGWFIFLMYTLIRFRQKPGHVAEYHTKHFKLPTYLEAAIVVIEAALLVGFAFPIWSQARNEMPDRSKALEVRVVAEQFAWNVHYPGPDGVFGKTDPKLMKASNPIGLDRTDLTAVDDITTINQLKVPVDKPIIVHLTSKDVIHSFALTVARVKQDVIPGQEIPVWFTLKQTGNFEIACAQLCGLGHYRMRGFFNVMSPSDFKVWMDKEIQKKLAKK